MHAALLRIKYISEGRIGKQNNRIHNYANHLRSLVFVWQIGWVNGFFVGTVRDMLADTSFYSICKQPRQCSASNKAYSQW